MKLITLNTWGGRHALSKLLEFFKKNADVDVFCLQEIWNGGEEMVGQQAGGMELLGVSTTLLADIGNVLSGHQVFFRPHFHDYYGLAMFVKKTIRVLEEGDVFVYKEPGYVSEEDKGNHARNLQYLKMDTATLCNFHGLWNGKGKTDSEDRVLQSENIVKVIQRHADPLILCGDFNLRPDTQSIAILERAGLRNLVKEYGVTSTRTSLYAKEEKFADYIFVSKSIQVNDFKVLPEEVSDHAPLYLDFDIV